MSKTNAKRQTKASEVETLLDEGSKTPREIVAFLNEKYGDGFITSSYVGTIKCRWRTNRKSPICYYGDVVEGTSGVSATRLAEHLGVTPSTLKKVASPCGVMKIRYRSQFAVYAATHREIERLESHPEIKKARERKAKRSATASYAAFKAAQTRRNRCIERMCRDHCGLRDLYADIVGRLWSPDAEYGLLNDEFYSNYPARLWEILKPLPEWEYWASSIITNIMWACTKRRTWKVNGSGDQDVPLALRLVDQDADRPEWIDMFAAAVRHTFYEQLPKHEGREKAIRDLEERSQRFALQAE